jgi:hypothetical protein
MRTVKLLRVRIRVLSTAEELHFNVFRQLILKIRLRLCLVLYRYFFQPLMLYESAEGTHDPILGRKFSRKPSEDYASAW